MYKVSDIVRVRSPAGPAIPIVHVKLLKKVVVRSSKGRTMDWPGYTGWEAKLIYKREVDMLRKKFRIPFKWPNDIETFVFEEDIITQK